MTSLSSSETSIQPVSRRGTTSWLLWVALLVAFSPVLVDQGKHWLDVDWTRYSIVFAPLLAWTIYRSPPAEPRRRLGIALVTGSLVLQLIAARAGMLELARPAFSLSVIGLALITGLATLRAGLLALWIVPVPDFVIGALGGGALARELFATVAAPLAGLGLELQVIGRVLVSGDRELTISAAYFGVPLFVLLSGLGWYRALQLQLSPIATLRCLVVYLIWGVPIQFAAIVLALLAFALNVGDGVTASRALLEPVPWIMCTVAAISLGERRAGGDRAGRNSPRRFVLLDRDGTLVHDQGYSHRVEDYERLPGVVEGLQRLRDAGYRFAIITNQSGIGRGYYTEQAFRDFQAHLLDDLARFEIAIEGVYFCPHRPDEGCSCRKPEPDMLHQLSRELGVAPGQCWVVGDGLGDVLLAQRAGCRGVVLVTTGLGGKTSEQVGPEVPRASDLREAADIILARDLEAGGREDREDRGEQSGGVEA